MTWRSGGQETPGRVEKIDFRLPADVQLEPIPAHKTLSQMLEEGNWMRCLQPLPLRVS